MAYENLELAVSTTDREKIPGMNSDGTTKISLSLKFTGKPWIVFTLSRKGGNITG